MKSKYTYHSALSEVVINALLHLQFKINASTRFIPLAARNKIIKDWLEPKVKKRNYKEFEIRKTIPNNSKKEISTRDKDFLDKIWSMYGKHDGIYLSALTHEEGTPWKNVYCKGCNSILEDNLIYEHYKEKLIPTDE